MQYPFSHFFFLPLRIIYIFALGFFLYGCWTVQPLEDSELGQYRGFIQDGKTTKQEVRVRLGQSSSAYEKNRILIYHVFLKDDGRMVLKDSGTCHALVLVFDQAEVLDRHRIVKYGCQENPT